MSDFKNNALNAMSKSELIDIANALSEKKIKQSDFFNNRGRFFIDRAVNLSDSQAKDELAFSNVIKSHHEKSDYSHLFGDGEGLHGALTMFQWLTTHIGRGVLDEALRATGRKIVPIAEGRDHE